jgi:hypothetical protein
LKFFAGLLVMIDGVPIMATWTEPWPSRSIQWFECPACGRRCRRGGAAGELAPAADTTSGTPCSAVAVAEKPAGRFMIRNCIRIVKRHPEGVARRVLDRPMAEMRPGVVAGIGRGVAAGHGATCVRGPERRSRHTRADTLDQPVNLITSLAVTTVIAVAAQRVVRAVDMAITFRRFRSMSSNAGPHR